MAESQKTFAFKTKSFNEKNILPNTGISDSKVKHPFQKILSKTFELGQIINNISNNPAKIHPASIRDFLHNISNIRTIFKNYIPPWFSNLKPTSSLQKIRSMSPKHLFSRRSWFSQLIPAFT